MAKSPTTMAPPPPPPPAPVVEPTGTRDDPFLYSDGTPIVYNDGETEEQYRARVQKMIDDAAAAPQTQSFDPATNAAGVVGEDNTATQLNAANGGGTDTSVVPAAAPPDASLGEIPGSTPLNANALSPAVPVGTTPETATIPSTVAEAQPGGMATSSTAGVADGDNVTMPIPSEYKTMDEYLAAQSALAAAVTAAHADAQPAAEPELTEQQQAEQDYVDALDIDGRLRRVEAQLGLRSPTLLV